MHLPSYILVQLNRTRIAQLEGLPLCHSCHTNIKIIYYHCDGRWKTTKLHHQMSPSFLWQQHTHLPTTEHKGRQYHMVRLLHSAWWWRNLHLLLHHLAEVKSSLCRNSPSSLQADFIPSMEDSIEQRDKNIKNGREVVFLPSSGLLHEDHVHNKHETWKRNNRNIRYRLAGVH